MADLDQALARFQLAGFEYGAGVPNYGPMAAAGLVELGHDALIVGLIDVYAPRLSDCPTGEPVPDAERGAALGRRDAFGGWLARFEAALEGQSWQELLRTEVPVLVEGIGAASAHALVRTAHAVQVLDAKETPVRRRELAFGLAHWSGCYEVGSEAEGFAIDDEEDLDAGIQHACIEGAEHYLAHPNERAANTLGVTGPASLALLAPHVDSSALAIGLARLRALAPQNPAPVPGAGPASMVDDVEVARCAESCAEIGYRAACSLQEHAISFVAACLRRNAVEPDPMLRMAAADAALRLSPPGYQPRR